MPDNISVQVSLIHENRYVVRRKISSRDPREEGIHLHVGLPFIGKFDSVVEKFGILNISILSRGCGGKSSSRNLKVTSACLAATRIHQNIQENLRNTKAFMDAEFWKIF